jgi:hypothetical protein
VIIHPFELENPFRAGDYPELQYTDISRARILHVFRDRGEQTETVSPPRDREGIPVGAY